MVIIKMALTAMVMTVPAMTARATIEKVIILMVMISVDMTFMDITKTASMTPKEIQPDDSVRTENVDLRFEQEYLAKCIKEVQRIKDNEFIA